MTLVLPSLKDPRVVMACALTLWTYLGQKAYYFNTDLLQLSLAVSVACGLDILLHAWFRRQWIVPLSAYLTALSIGLLLESSDWRVFVVAPFWGVMSKWLLHDGKAHFFNPSNFALVVMVLLSHGTATIAPGSQWGADYRLSIAILCIGMFMMLRLKRIELAAAWVVGYVLMSLLRVAAGQGGIIFALGPMTGAEFALFTFSMLPDPKASPTTRKGRFWWGLSIAIMDGVMRYMEIRYSMFYALFLHTAILPIMRRAAARKGAAQTDPWRLVRIPFRQSKPAKVPASATTQA